MSDGLPAEFRLEQNYPNPFNPVTKIKFAIAAGEKVKLEIFNITGQKITTLLDRKLKAGEYEVEWNAGNVASGVYFYQFSYGNLVQTKKMVLIR
jgi:methionine-rich copper-binding protein CopC